MVWKVQKRKGSQGASRILAISSLVILYFSKIAIFSAFIRLQFSSFLAALFWPVLPKKGSHFATVQWGRKAHALHRKGNLKKKTTCFTNSTNVCKTRELGTEREREREGSANRLTYIYICTDVLILMCWSGTLGSSSAKKQTPWACYQKCMALHLARPCPSRW